MRSACPASTGGVRLVRRAWRARQGSPHMTGLVLLFLVWAGLQTGPTAQTIERVTFEDAVRRAVTNHPTIQGAAADIGRASAILQQVRSRSRPSIDASLVANVIDPVTQFGGTAITPRTQTLTTAAVSVP